MFKRKKKKTGCETHELRKCTPSPNPGLVWQPKDGADRPQKPPTSGSNAQVPLQLTIPPMPPVQQPQPPIGRSSVQAPKKLCPYETPCGWCTKWDKKCDKKIGCESQSFEKHKGLFSPCYDCRHDGTKLLQCLACSSENGYQYFMSKEN